MTTKFIAMLRKIDEELSLNPASNRKEESYISGAGIKTSV